MLLWDLRWFYFLAIACGRIWQILCLFNLFLPLWQDYSFALTFKSVDEILWCYHSNESSLGELLLSIIYFLGFYKTKFVSFCDWFFWSSKAVMKFYFEFWQLHIIFFSIQLSKRNSILRISDFWYVADKRTSLKARKTRRDINTLIGVTLSQLHFALIWLMSPAISVAFSGLITPVFRLLQNSFYSSWKRPCRNRKIRTLMNFFWLKGIQKTVCALYR